MKQSSPRFWPVLLILSLVSGGAYYVLSGNGETPEAEQAKGGGIPVVTYSVVAAPLKAEISNVGTLEAGEAASLRAEVPGTVAEIHFNEGTPVKKGDLLLAIDPRTYQEKYNQAMAAYELARLTENRRRKLLKNKFISAQAVDEAAGSLRGTRSAMEAAKLRLEKTKITAPFDGVVGLRSLSVGDFLTVGDTVTDVVALDPMKMQVAVPERYLSRLRDRLAVRLSVDAWPGREFGGELYAVNPTVDANTRNVTIKAVIRNEDFALRPGMYARVNLSLGESENALMVPEEAIISQGEKVGVMKVVEDKAVPAEVTLGLRRDGKVEVLTGLAAGDVVVTAGQMKLQPGAPVTAILPD